MDWPGLLTFTYAVSPFHSLLLGRCSAIPEAVVKEICSPYPYKLIACFRALRYKCGRCLGCYFHQQPDNWRRKDDSVYLCKPAFPTKLLSDVLSRYHTVYHTSSLRRGLASTVGFVSTGVV